MSDLEKWIGEWRRSTLAASRISGETLEELENHLRETVEHLIRSGVEEAAAFRQAVAQLGLTPVLAAEFQKLEQPVWLPVKVAAGFGLIAALACAVFLAIRVDAGRLSVLLAAHALSVTLGFTCTFLIGALGICFVSQRCVSDFSASLLRSIRSGTSVLGTVALALTTIGVILGMIWTKKEWGRYWGWDVKETGAFVAVLWQLCFLLAHRVGARSVRSLLVTGILGNIVIGMSWFGPNLLSNPSPYGSVWIVLLIAFGFNLVMVLLGCAPAGWLRLRKG